MILISKSIAKYGREPGTLKMMETFILGGENLDVILKPLIIRKFFLRNAMLERLSLHNEQVIVMKKIIFLFAHLTLPLLSLAIRTKTMGTDSGMHDN